MIIDVHAHFDDEKFNCDIDECLKKAKEAGVTHIINAAVDYETSLKSLELARKYDFIYCVLGIHPDSADEYSPEKLAAIAKKTEAAAIFTILLPISKVVSALS